MAVPDLLRDSQRRLSQAAGPHVDFAAVWQGRPAGAEFRRLPQSERIRILIDALQDVQGGKVTFPGPLSFSSDPVFELLPAEGPDADQPLREAVANDTRLTRTFDYSRAWTADYRPVRVKTVIGELFVSLSQFPLVVRPTLPRDH